MSQSWNTVRIFICDTHRDTFAGSIIKSYWFSRTIYHESLNNLTPADVYFGRTQEVLSQRAMINQHAMQLRHLAHAVAWPLFSGVTP